MTIIVMLNLFKMYFWNWKPSAEVVVVNDELAVTWIFVAGRSESRDLDGRDTDGHHAGGLCGRHSQRSCAAGRPDEDLGRRRPRRPTGRLRVCAQADLCQISFCFVSKSSIR